MGVIGTVTCGVAAFGCVATVVVPSTPAPAADDDVPTREPQLSWEMQVECDTAAELAADPTAPRRCSLGVDDDTLYIHQHTDPNAGSGSFGLTAVDITTGERRWSSPTIPSTDLVILDHAVVVADKSRIEVLEPASGSRRFVIDGRFAQANTYDVLLLDDGETVTAIDAITGATLWTEPGAVAGACRDIVVLTGTPSTPEPFRVVEHRTGALRWRSDVDFDRGAHHLRCSARPVIYTTDGAAIHEWDVYDGWLNWSVPVDDAGSIEIYREVALVRSGAAGETTVAIARDTGEVLWNQPSSSVGAPVSMIGRLREDASGVFVLHPLTGEVVQHVNPGVATVRRFRVVGASATRVVIAVGSRVTTYGLNDLGVAWSIDVGGAPDDFAVASGVLVVRTGETLRGYS